MEKAKAIKLTAINLIVESKVVRRKKWPSLHGSKIKKAPYLFAHKEKTWMRKTN